MTIYRTLLLSVLSAAALMATALPAQAQVDVGVSIGFPGGYGFAGPAYAAPVYVAPRPVYVQPPPVYINRDDRWRRHEREVYYRDRHERREHHDNDWRGGRDGYGDHDGRGDRGRHEGWRR